MTQAHCACIQPSIWDIFFKKVSDLLTAPAGPEACKNPAELARYAYSIQDTDPGFAADLLAAIMRGR